MNTSKEMKTKKMRAAGFTLVEIMIVVAIIGLLITVAVPKFGQMRKDAQQTACFMQLKQIDANKELWATKEKRSDGQTPTEDQLAVWFQDGFPICPGGGEAYSIGAVGEKATCSVHGAIPANK